MGTMSKVKTLTAAKKQRCSWCGEIINVGEQYFRYRFWNNKEVGVVKMHPECFDAMQDAAEEEGGWFEWSYGECERPFIST